MNKLQKVWKIFSVSEKKNFIFLNFLNIGNLFLEALSLGLIIPLIGAMLDMENFSNSKIYSFIQKIYFNEEIKNTMIFLSLCLLFTFIFKNILIMLITYKQNKFITSLEKNISKKILEEYLKKPYEFFIENNSSILISNINNETREFAYHFIAPLITLITEAFIFLGIILVLLYFDFNTSIVIFILLLIFGGIYLRLFNPILSEWGFKRQNYLRSKLKHLQQSIGAIKEIKIFGNSSFFIKIFSEFNNLNAHISKNYLTVSQLPKSVFEIIGISGITFSIIIMINLDLNFNSIFTKVTIFSIAIIRLIPVFNKISMSIQKIRYSDAAIKMLDDFFSSNVNEKKADEKKIIFNNNIKLKNISFEYKNSKNKSLSNINLEIKKNEKIALVGPSGSGKSTLINILTGLINPTDGKIFIDEEQNSLLSSSWKSKIGFVPQFSYFLDDTIKKNITFGRGDIEKKIEETIKLSNLENVIKKLDKGIDTPIGESASKLSGGEKQRVSIARALFSSPQILIMDESTSALDADTEEIILNEIKNLKNLTIIFSTHRDTVKKFADKVIYLKNGELEKIL